MLNKNISRYAIYGMVLVFGLLGGCSTHSALTYSVSPENVVSLRKLKKKVTVGDFSSTQVGLRQVDCRMVGPVEPPEGMTFAEYIKKAFVGELQMAEKYDSQSDIVLTGNLNNIELSSYSGTWTIDMTLSSSNGRKITKNIVYNFKSNFMGEIACEKAAQSLQPAVQNAIKALVTDDDFVLLVK